MGLPIRIPHVAPEEVGVELGRCDIGMAEEFLHDTQVCPAIEEMRRKRVAQRMGMDLTPEACRDGSRANRRPG